LYYGNLQKMIYKLCIKFHPIGYVNVGINDSYDFGYGLCKEFWHKGIVTEAGRAVIEQLKRMVFHILQRHMMSTIREAAA
ncbi:MAG: GNAT family N-acetyltransferase, partial [Lachnospiraceae bacterium]|nr:GNAT family N-acetyltransferase [Lachnospiraceae bacterium]